MPSTRYARSTLVLSLCTLFGLGALTCTVTNATTPAASARTPIAPDAKIADIAEASVTAVVNISATRVTRNNHHRSPFHDDPLFREFFRRFDAVPRERQQRSLGSGVLVTHNGIVITNNHVVEHTKDIQVTFSNGKEFEAEIVGTDPKSDLAVIRLKGNIKGLSPLQLGNSDQLRLGEVVLAIGNPFGVGQTVTMGIVSAKGRANVGIVDYENFIQTDAAINPGNSGGALVNMRGELVGINTAILSRSGGYQGVGFAIPSNMVRNIMDSLIKNGKVVRGWLGVAIQDIDADLSHALELGSTDGVLVANVQAGSPAEKANFQRGDVIVQVEKQRVRTTAQLRHLIASLAPRSRVSIRVIRKGKSKTLSVILGTLPTEATAANEATVDKENAVFGLRVADLDTRTRAQFRIPGNISSGAVVVQVASGSRAEKAGLRPGDVIVETNRKTTRSAKAFYKIAQNSKNSLLLLVQRRGGTTYLVLRK